MKYEIYRTTNELKSLSGEWNSLLTRSRADTVFLTWQWISAWLNMREPSLRLFVVAIRDEHQQLVGLAPFYQCSYRVFGAIPCKCLRIIGDSNSAGEYGNLVAAKHVEADVLQEIMQILHAHRSEWDFVWIHNMANWSCGSKMTINAIDHSLLKHRTQARCFSYISLPDTYSKFLSGVSANLRRSMKRAHRELLENETTRVTEPSNHKELADALVILMQLHEKRWTRLGQIGSLSKLPMLMDFHQSFAAQAQSQGWLKLYVMVINGAPAAAQYGLVYGNTFLQILEGFDPDKSSGAGSALRCHVLRDLCDRGVSEYDFLGGYTSHKQRWSAAERTGCDLLVTNSRTMSQMLHLLPIWPTGRFVKYVSVRT